MKVYVVEEAIEDSSNVVCVFTDIERAKKYRDEFQNIYLSEFELDEPPPINSLSPIRNKDGLIPYRVCIFRDGDLLDIKMDHYTLLIHGDGENNRFIRKERYEGDNVVYKTYLETHVLASDEKHAIKIANDRRTMLIADKWPDDIVRQKGPPRPSNPLSSSD